MYLTRNQAYVQTYRGFESHPLRQNTRDQIWTHYAEDIQSALPAAFNLSPRVSPAAALRASAWRAASS